MIVEKETKIKVSEKVYIDPETSELVSVKEILKTYHGQQHFWKLYMSDFLHTLGITLESKQLDVVLYILSKVKTNDNMFIGTYDHIVEKGIASRPTIARIFKKMKTAKLLIKKHAGAYMVDPSLLMKGSPGKRQALMIEFRSAEQKTVKEERIEMQKELLQTQISKLQKQLNNIEKVKKEVKNND